MMNNILDLGVPLWTSLGAKILGSSPTANTPMKSDSSLLLDPMTTVIQLAIIAFKGEGIKIGIRDNQVHYYDIEYYKSRQLQGLHRAAQQLGATLGITESCAVSKEGYSLFEHSIIRAAQWYRPDCNKNVKRIFLLCMEGLLKLKETYTNETSNVKAAIASWVRIIDRTCKKDGIEAACGVESLPLLRKPLRLWESAAYASMWTDQELKAIRIDLELAVDHFNTMSKKKITAFLPIKREKLQKLCRRLDNAAVFDKKGCVKLLHLLHSLKKNNDIDSDQCIEANRSVVAHGVKFKQWTDGINAIDDGSYGDNDSSEIFEEYEQQQSPSSTVRSSSSTISSFNEREERHSFQKSESRILQLLGEQEPRVVMNYNAEVASLQVRIGGKVEQFKEIYKLETTIS